MAKRTTVRRHLNSCEFSYARMRDVASNRIVVARPLDLVMLAGGALLLGATVAASAALTTDHGELLTRNTIRLALVWYFAAAVIDDAPRSHGLASRNDRRPRRPLVLDLGNCLFPDPRRHGVSLLSSLVACRSLRAHASDQRPRRRDLLLLSLRPDLDGRRDLLVARAVPIRRAHPPGSTACCTASCCSWCSTA